MKKVMFIVAVATLMVAPMAAKNSMSSMKRAEIETEKMVNTYKQMWGMDITEEQKMKMLEIYRTFFIDNFNTKPEENIVNLESYRDQAYEVYTDLALNLKPILTPEQYRQFLIHENSRIYQVQSYLINRLGMNE